MKVSTGAKNPPMVASTASARESCTTDSTTAPAVTTTTAVPAGPAPNTPWTGYPA